MAIYPLPPGEMGGGRSSVITSGNQTAMQAGELSQQFHTFLVIILIADWSQTWLLLKCIYKQG